MKVTAQEEYGLRCMLQAAASDPDRPVNAAHIASHEGLSVPYVGKLLHLLKEAGLVESLRGRSGGYYIARPPEQISISEILHALGDALFTPEYCERFPGEGDECVHIGECSLRSLWGTLEGVIDQVLQRTTLADLLTSEQSVRENLSTRHRCTLPVVPIVSMKPMTANPDRATDESDDD